MENVKCSNCGEHFTFDPRKVWNSPHTGKSGKTAPTGVVLIPCPHCTSLRKFLLNPEHSEPARIRRPNRSVRKTRAHQVC